MTLRAKAWAWLLDYLYAAFWQVHAFLRPGTPDRYRNGGKRPVLLLPGIYETWQFMRPLAEELHAAGHPVHVATGLGRNRATIPDAARVVTKVLDARDLRDVIVVAHSKGGLIGKYLMMQTDAADRIDSMAAVVAPFSGSSLARYTVLPSLRAFAPTDAMIRLLGEERAVNARITSVYGVFDPHIPGGSMLPGATNVQLEVAGHFRILGDPAVRHAVMTACGD
ncbi:esterase/lipase family protein [Cryobacterium tepidiphilum]|uniref:Alpha/beta hydrolase n=1 Tax=Cryobacterium tepidiphilum TaxID=2486026 RepID=A0A3M8LPP6_9MICO|nr:alpha/beta fold hydrolase [Cryobacterium tepidiphilum]RNE66458.1 alpha/beta hydrolase [Cryobacterium tepidiphilum]